jgi:Fe-S oxidoreductase
MDGGWGMKAENFEESMKVGERCANDLCAVKADSACSDCSLASLQLTQASKESLLMTHPIIMLHKAYGLDQKTSK